MEGRSWVGTQWNELKRTFSWTRKEHMWRVACTRKGGLSVASCMLQPPVTHVAGCGSCMLQPLVTPPCTGCSTPPTPVPHHQAALAKTRDQLTRTQNNLREEAKLRAAAETEASSRAAAMAKANSEARAERTRLQVQLLHYTARNVAASGFLDNMISASNAGRAGRVLLCRDGGETVAGRGGRESEREREGTAETVSGGGKARSGTEEEPGVWWCKGGAGAKRTFEMYRRSRAGNANVFRASGYTISGDRVSMGRLATVTRRGLLRRWMHWLTLYTLLWSFSSCEMQLSCLSPSLPSSSLLSPHAHSSGRLSKGSQGLACRAGLGGGQ